MQSVCEFGSRRFPGGQNMNFLQMTLINSYLCWGNVITLTTAWEKLILISSVGCPLGTSLNLLGLIVITF